MTCTCPKCKAAFELDVVDIPAEGLLQKCPACQANVAVQKESFAKRALYQNPEIYCAECGNNPGPAIYCQNCQAIYPDILTVATASAAKRQLDKITTALKKLNYKFKPQPARKSYNIDDFTTPVAGKKPKAGIKLPGTTTQLVVTLVLLLVAIGAGGFYWYQEKIATEYAEQYVKTIFSVKGARDFDLLISSRLVTSWKAGGASALSANELKMAETSHRDVSLTAGRIGKVPKNFAGSDETLKKLLDSYQKLHAATTGSSPSADIYAGEIKKMDDDFMKSARELKAGLPEKISTRLAESKRKYKQLQDF